MSKKYVFNPFTGQFDTVEAPRKTVTHTLNSAGHEYYTYDNDDSMYVLDLKPLVVVDNNGDVVETL